MGEEKGVKVNAVKKKARRKETYKNRFHFE